MAACGSDFTVAVTEDGELFAWGEGGRGHLGLGAVLHQQQPARAGGPETVWQPAHPPGRGWLAPPGSGGGGRGGLHMRHGDDGQLGLGDGQLRRRLTRVPQALFAGSRVVMVSCGDNRTRWR